MRLKFNLIAIIAVGSIILSSCKPTPSPAKTEEELQIEKLSKTWVLAAGSDAVTQDGTSVTDAWTGFTITLGDKTYQTSSSSSAEVWPANGTWSFGANVNTLVRDDGTSMTVSVTDTSILLQFDYSATGGRLNGIEGSWSFSMVPQ